MLIVKNKYKILVFDLRYKPFVKNKVFLKLFFTELIKMLPFLAKFIYIFGFLSLVACAVDAKDKLLVVIL